MSFMDLQIIRRSIRLGAIPKCDDKIHVLPVNDNNGKILCTGVAPTYIAPHQDLEQVQNNIFSEI